MPTAAARGTPQLKVTRRALLRGSLEAASAGLLLVGCTGINNLVRSSTPTSSVNTSTPISGGLLRISQPADVVPTGTPYQFTGANLHLLTLVYNTLVAYDTQLMAHPRLATGWAWSADSRRLTLTLRQGVKFHSGRPFTSSDAKFNLEHVRDPAVGSQWQNYANLMRVSAPDPTTLVIDYDMPVKSTFDALTAPYMADPMSLDDINAGRTFIGTGPFRFHEWAAGDRVTFLRNNDFWQPGRPYLDQVDIRITPDAQSALVALESGSVDWMAGVRPATRAACRVTPITGFCSRRMGASLLRRPGPHGADVRGPAGPASLELRVEPAADGRHRAVRIWSSSIDSLAATFACV